MPLPEPFDSADLDAILELERSRGWALMSARLDVELERRRRNLENDCDLPLTAYTRGYIAALRMWLQLPEILKQEVKAAL